MRTINRRLALLAGVGIVLLLAGCRNTAAELPITLSTTRPNLLFIYIEA